MIQTIITHTCPDCGSTDIVKNGHDYKGNQQFHCKNCNRYGTLHAQKGYSYERREQVKRAVLERVSLRGIKRIFNMSRHTVSQWLRQWLQDAPPIEDMLHPMQWGDVLELDELWSFVGNKSQKR